MRIFALIPLLALVACGSEPQAAAPQPQPAPAAAAAPTPAAPASSDTGLSEAEAKTLQASYEQQAAQSITADNAEAMAAELEKQIAADGN